MVKPEQKNPLKPGQENRTVENPGWVGSANRRGFLLMGILAVTAWAAAGMGGSRLFAQSSSGGRQKPDDFFSPIQRSVFSACAAVILGKLLPGEKPKRAQAMAEIAHGVERYLAKMPQYTQAEVRQMFDVLSFAPVRALIAGVWSTWEMASVEETAAFLENFRTSRFALKRRIYQTLHELTAVGWFGHPMSWPGIGYPGPPEVPRPQPRGEA